MKFSIEHTDNTARIGTLALPHGEIKTPVFMPVGTQATIKGVHLSHIQEYGARIILNNTYHLFLRPGLDILKQFSGIHSFQQWPHNILTDSGGFQVFSLSALRKLTENGVLFNSHITGAQHLFTPESVVDAQCIFNSDIQMVLDVCTPPNISHEDAHDALQLTTKWAKRAYAQWQRHCDEGYQGACFGIVQGNFFKDLRTKSIDEICAIPFPGYAIGGLSVGEPPEQFEDFLQYTAQDMPYDKPRYVMGIGTPEYIFAAVTAGIDMFDCVLPTRTARIGTFFTEDGKINILNSHHSHSTHPISETSCIQQYSRAYLRHLFKAKEMLGPMLASLHNTHFLLNLMNDIRTAIAQNRFHAFKTQFLTRYCAHTARKK